MSIKQEETFVKVLNINGINERQSCSEEKKISKLNVNLEKDL